METIGFVGLLMGYLPLKESEELEKVSPILAMYVTPLKEKTFLVLCNLNYRIYRHVRQTPSKRQFYICPVPQKDFFGQHKYVNF